jgi:uncharacterized sporulation protein YeaH/YhbH (DUF444 family)
MRNETLPTVQYMAYLEISDRSKNSSLWKAYHKLANETLFSVRKIYEVNEIWPVFRGLFRKAKVLEN